MKNRANRILELLIEHKKIEVAELSKELEVSQVTIRKDLDALCERGIVIREHGFALLKSEDNINGRIAYHYEAKLLIAKKAATMVSDGDTIMIESGSCCALFAQELAKTRKDLTIITNSSFIADYVKANATFQIVLLGGIYQPDAQVMVGPMVRQCAENFMVDYFFIGTDGYSPRTGFTNQDQMRAQAVRDMAQQAEYAVFITESEKFSRHGIVPLNLRESKIKVITDDQIEPSVVKELEEKNIEVITI